MYKFNFLSCIKIVDFVMMPDEKMSFVEEWCVSNIKVSGSRYASVFFKTYQTHFWEQYPIAKLQLDYIK